MSNSVRIRTTPNGDDKYLKVKLDQDFDFIEVLSLKISQEDAYRKFCSDYGVIVGRVSINSGFGVPNAKVSVFLPLDEVDKLNPEIKGLYPYEVITDKNNDGVRYNLLPSETDSQDTCFTPIGSFGNKREVLDNDLALEVYCKYYKFTTTTNHAGDFMIFGVPLGTYTVHVDADISDIGIASQKPYDLISQGTPSKLFASPTKFKGGTNLDKLLQIKTLNSGVNVQPFWGDVENCEVGITRLDFDLNHTIRPAAIFMGSIFGDAEKHSVNKYCRPRKALGELCEQITNAGSVDMIRKDTEGNIEEFSVEGGRVIDADGTWAYQIPMNLDYMITDEEGNLVLSEDPNKGVPTRASVRFKIGMDESGSIGRLRTRAKFLVPNNPKNISEIDYEFGQDTKDSSFRDLYWNKIYTVSNFISRFQRNNFLDKLTSIGRTRSTTAVKDVDDCVGTKTPFPYNRVNSNLNPIFFIICLIIKIISFLIWIMNAIFIPIINFIIGVINAVLKVICQVIRGIGDIVCAIPGTGKNCDSRFCTGNWNGSSCDCNNILDKVPCVYVQCPVDDGSNFAPGCSSGSDGFQVLSSRGTNINYYEGDPSGHKGPLDTGLDNCIAFEMAKVLEIFQFDFYNDWVNGTLFAFLLKYKKKKRGREIFCEYDCGDYGIAAGGVDGNHNGIPDNDCLDSVLVDSCFRNGASHNGSIGYNTEDEIHTNGNVREGVIKKIGDEFFYAATTHNVAWKLYATEIVSIGSVFDCDWQGIPKLQPLLIPTTYKIPPDIQELAPDNKTVETSGMVDIGGTTCSVFFSIDCLGVHMDNKGILNVRHISEFGVDIDQAQADPATGIIITPADCIIGANDMNDNGGEFFRDVFYGLNINGPNVPNYVPLTTAGFTSNFNLNNIGNYDYTAPSVNGNDYLAFRGVPLFSDYSYQQSKHSYFFYFGLLPGKTALDKMNERFFTQCNVKAANDILIVGTPTNVTTVSGNNGTITFTIIGGTVPYQYSIVGINGTSYQNPITGTITLSNNGPVTITGLVSGTYVINITDTNGNPASQTVVVSEPPSFYCAVSVTKNATALTGGEISIGGVGGGVTGFTGGYSYTAMTFGGAVLQTGNITTIPTTIGGLAKDMTNGYTVIVSDGSIPAQYCITSGLTVDGPIAMNITTTKQNIKCFNGNDGVISVNIIGGQAPFTVTTIGPTPFNTTNSPNLNVSGLTKGTYVSRVIDSLGTSATSTTVLTELTSQMVIDSGTAAELDKQCSPIVTNIPLYISAGGTSTVYITYSIDGGPSNTVAKSFVNSSTPINLPINTPILSSITIRFSDGNPYGCSSNSIQVNKPSITLPTTPLSLNITGVNNAKQCSSTVTTTMFNITGGKGGPYVVDWYLSTGINGTGITGAAQTLTTSLVQPSLSNTEIFNSPYQYINIKVTEDSGCNTFLSIPYPKRPTSVLDTVLSVSGGPTYTHTWTGVGGIAPYTGIPTSPFIDLNPTFTVTITDSVGCTVTKTG